jgi:hypothetical protein
MDDRLSFFNHKKMCGPATRFGPTFFLSFFSFFIYFFFSLFFFYLFKFLVILESLHIKNDYF